MVGGNDSWDSPLLDGVQEVPFTPWSCPFPLNYVDAISSEREREREILGESSRDASVPFWIERTNEQSNKRMNECVASFFGFHNSVVHTDRAVPDVHYR